MSIYQPPLSVTLFTYKLKLLMDSPNEANHPPVLKDGAIDANRKSTGLRANKIFGRF